jgi:cell division protein FtsZ
LSKIAGGETNIAIIGIGGCGCNILNRLYEVGAPEATVVAAHTESVHLSGCLAPNRVLLGQTSSRGHGTGANPPTGETAMKEDGAKILNQIGSPNLVMVAGGLGGGTASGGIPPLLHSIAEKSPEAVRLAIVTFPFSYEGVNRIENAVYGLRRTIEAADLTLVNMNDMLYKQIGTIPAQYAFKYMDCALVNTLKGVIDLVTKPKVLSISFADFVSVTRGMDIGVVGHGVGSKVQECTQMALKNRMLDADFKGAKGALIYVEAPPNTSLEEAGAAPNALTTEHGIERVFWGLRLDPSVEKPQAMIVASGIRSSNLDHLVGRVEKIF